MYIPAVAIQNSSQVLQGVCPAIARDSSQAVSHVVRVAINPGVLFTGYVAPEELLNIVPATSAVTLWSDYCGDDLRCFVVGFLVMGCASLVLSCLCSDQE